MRSAFRSTSYPRAVALLPTLNACFTSRFIVCSCCCSCSAVASDCESASSVAPSSNSWCTPCVLQVSNFLTAVLYSSNLCIFSASNSATSCCSCFWCSVSASSSFKMSVSSFCPCATPVCMPCLAWFALCSSDNASCSSLFACPSLEGLVAAM